MDDTLDEFGEKADACIESYSTRMCISRRWHRTFRGFRTGVQAVSVSPVSRAVSLLLLDEQLPHVGVAQANADSTGRQAVDYRVGLHAAEPAVPVGRRVLCAEDGGAVHVAPLHELKQELYGHVADVLGEPLVDHEQLVAGALPQDHGVRALGRPQHVALYQQVGQPYVVRAPAHPARLLGNAARQAALALAGSALHDRIGRSFPCSREYKPSSKRHRLVRISGTMSMRAWALVFLSAR